MDLEDYLRSKKIDASTFQMAESALWKEWSIEFENMHPNSFTLQKLNLINPIRRKYPLKTVPEQEKTASQASTPSPDTANASPPSSITSKPAIPKPVFKPKPKMP
jgi:hypothetical protein